MYKPFDKEELSIIFWLTNECDWSLWSACESVLDIRIYGKRMVDL